MITVIALISTTAITLTINEAQEMEAKLQLERVGATMMAGEEARKTTEAEKRAQVAAALDEQV